MENESSEIFAIAIHKCPNSFILNYSCGELLSKNNAEKAMDYYRRCIKLYKTFSENKEFKQEYNTALKKVKGINFEFTIK